MNRTRLALTIAVVAGGLFLAVATVPAFAQSAGWMPMQGQGSSRTQGMMGSHGHGAMHGEGSTEFFNQMQDFHAQMPAELRDQMQAWHQEQGMAGMMRMMTGSTDVTAMHAQMPTELRDQMDAWYAQLPEDAQAQMTAMHTSHSMGALHGHHGDGAGHMVAPASPADNSPAAEPES